MTYAAYKPTPLWQRFMPRHKEIQNALGEDLILCSSFCATFWEQFDPTASFDKWVGIEVSAVDTVPSYEIANYSRGFVCSLYLVGDEKNGSCIFLRILVVCRTIYDLDNRPF
jgi:AraC family transcriptional regulator